MYRCAQLLAYTYSSLSSIVPARVSAALPELQAPRHLGYRYHYHYHHHYHHHYHDGLAITSNATPQTKDTRITAKLQHLRKKLPFGRHPNKHGATTLGRMACDNRGTLVHPSRLSARRA